MNQRENLISLYRRKGYEKVPFSFSLCPSLMEKFREVYGTDKSPAELFGFASRNVGDGILRAEDKDVSRFEKYYTDLKPGSTIDIWGVGHEPGSSAAAHMTYMRNPLKNCETVSEMEEYPFPDFTKADYSHQKEQVDAIHAAGLAAEGGMQMTIWEAAWYMRGMEELMMDMLEEDEKADYILDYVTKQSCYRAMKYAEAGCDTIFLGDDVGMQHSIMMSERLYCDYLKPRLKQVIDAARKVNPDVLILYHSDGYVEPFIPHLIEIGVDVLNPIQPECMDFGKIHAQFGDRLSFNGTIGTQTTMPFGTPDDVRRAVFTNLEIAGDKGGLLPCPTHLLEPEVPWANIEAFIKACEDFK